VERGVSKFFLGRRRCELGNWRLDAARCGGARGFRSCRLGRELSERCLHFSCHCLVLAEDVCQHCFVAVFQPLLLDTLELADNVLVNRFELHFRVPLCIPFGGVLLEAGSRRLQQCTSLTVLPAALHQGSLRLLPAVVVCNEVLADFIEPLVKCSVVLALGRKAS
jgi:hypothetical protein